MCGIVKENTILFGSLRFYARKAQFSLMRCLQCVPPNREYRFNVMTITTKSVRMWGKATNTIIFMCF